MNKHLQIIDWKAKGNIVRFFLGFNGDQFGDDWNDRHWDINAGTVYAKFVQGYIDIGFPFQANLLNASSKFTKLHMRDRIVPFLLILTEDMTKRNADFEICEFDYWRKRDFRGILPLYFGDTINRIQAPHSVLDYADFRKDVFACDRCGCNQIYEVNDTKVGYLVREWMVEGYEGEKVFLPDELLPPVPLSDLHEEIAEPRFRCKGCGQEFDYCEGEES
jgi:hypothetical protein